MDAKEYIRNLGYIENDIFNIFLVMDGYRPFFFLILRAFQLLTGFNSINAVKYFPIVLHPSLVFASYYFINCFIKNNNISEWGAFFTAIGLKVVVGLYSYFLSELVNFLDIKGAYLEGSKFLEKFFGLQLSVSALETISRESSVKYEDYYDVKNNLPRPVKKTDFTVVGFDGKGVPNCGCVPQIASLVLSQDSRDVSPSRMAYFVSSAMP